MDYIIYVGAGVLGLAFISFLLDLLIKRNGDITEYTVIRCKNKVRKSRRYCYPRVVTDDGVEFYAYGAKTNGHDRYSVGDTLPFYKASMFNRKPRYAKNVHRNTITFAVTGALLLAAYFFQLYK